VPRLAFDYPPPPVPAAELKKQKAAAAAAGAVYAAPAWQRCIVYGRAVEAGLRCGQQREQPKTYFSGWNIRGIFSQLFVFPKKKNSVSQCPVTFLPICDCLFSLSSYLSLFISRHLVISSARTPW
jgi:hypothetical protein